jgi:hypothetical protein
MERKLAGVILFAVGCGIGLAFGALLTPGDPVVGRKVRDWFDFVDIGLRIATLFVFTGGLVGTFAVLTSLRAQTYSQMYGRFQSMLLKLAENPAWFDGMKREEYFDDPHDPAGPAAPHRFAANAMVNLYEEAFMLYHARVLSVFDMMPDDYWTSMLGSMRAAFKLKYVRTYWERRQSSFTPTFNQFVREHVIDEPPP